MKNKKGTKAVARQCSKKINEMLAQDYNINIHTLLLKSIKKEMTDLFFTANCYTGIRYIHKILS